MARMSNIDYTAINESDESEGIDTKDEVYIDDERGPITRMQHCEAVSDRKIYWWDHGRISGDRMESVAIVCSWCQCHSAVYMLASLRRAASKLLTLCKGIPYLGSAIAILLFISTTIVFARHHGLGLNPFQASTKFSTPIRLILRESAGYHDEVTASFMESLQSYGDVQTHIFLKTKRYKMEEIYDTFQWKREPFFDKHDNFTASTIKQLDPQVIISVTCAVDLEMDANIYEYILKEMRTVLLCVVHHPSKFYTTTEGPYRHTDAWRKSGRIRFITLASHVTDTLNEHLEAVQVNRIGSIGPWETYTYPPVFSIDEAVLKKELLIDERPSFILQGSITSGRRDYNHTFASFDKEVNSLALPTKATPQLVILGSGTGHEIRLTESMKDKIIFKTNLPYPAFYQTLRRGMGLIPAFADDQYYFDIASSSVAASLISTTPLIASPLLLRQYAYLDKSIVYLKKDNENAVQAALRLFGESPLFRSRLSAAVCRKRQHLIRANRLALRLWLQKIVTASRS